MTTVAEWIEGMKSEGGALDNSDRDDERGFVFCPRRATIRLDGWFTPEELRALAAYSETLNEPPPQIA